MSNHFHLVRHVPETRAPSELELLERIEAGRTAQLSERNGELPYPNVLRYLIRYFTDGVIWKARTLQHPPRNFVQ